MIIYSTCFFLVSLCVHTLGNQEYFWHRTKRESPASKGVNKWNVTRADELKRKLLTYYDKFSRPSINGNATPVTLDPTIHHIEVDEEKSIMSVHCWIKMVWKDEKLKWNSSEYELTELHLPDHEVWQPDIIPYNNAAGSTLDHFANTHVIVYADGTVLWVPPAILQVFCELDLRKWPFDSQSCNIKLGSWVYSGMQIDLNFSDDEPELTNFLPNAEWQFVSMTRKRNVVTYACCSEPYIDIDYTINIKRESPTYRALIITPITAIVFMTLSIFWLPPASGEKIFIGGITAVIVCMFLMYFSQRISIMVGHTPLIVYFYTGTLHLVAFSVVISCIVLRLTKTRRSYALPWIIKNHLTGWMATWLLLRNYQSQHSLAKSRQTSRNEDDSADIRPVLSDTQDTDLPEGQQLSSITSGLEHYYDEWLLLAAAIDRISFLFYCILFIAFALSYSV